MTTQEKIEKAEERIKELQILIFHWRKATNNSIYPELTFIDGKSKPLKGMLAA